MAVFKDILTIKNGKNQKAVENPQGRYPIYGSGGIMGYADSYICEPETVIIGRKGNINNPIFCEDYFWNIDTAFGLVAGKRRLLPKYLFYFCKKFDFQSLNTTVTIPSLTKTNLLNIHINLPSLSEQKRIAAILDKATELIALRKQQIQKLDLLVKSRFIEVSANWLEKFPAEALKSFLEVITYGFTNPMPDAEKGPWKITAKDIINGSINFDTARKTNLEAYESLTNKSRPNINDVLLTKDGTLGRCAVVDCKNICVNQSVAVLRCNKRILPKFLSLLLQMPEYQKEMLANSGGGTIKHIYITRVTDMLITVPSLNDQYDFLNFVEQIDKTKSTLQQSLEKLELNYKALMQTYFG